jgi:hypothetical protein
MGIRLLWGALGYTALRGAARAPVSVFTTRASTLESGLDWGLESGLPAGLASTSMESTGLRSSTGTNRSLGFRRLGRICAEQPVFKRRPVEPADDRVHLLSVRRFDKREPLGLLSFRIADDFDCVRDQVLGAQPALDIVRGDPSGQIAQENGKTHSTVVFDSICRGIAFQDVFLEGIIMLPQSSKGVNGNRSGVFICSRRVLTAAAQRRPCRTRCAPAHCRSTPGRDPGYRRD